MGVMDGTKVHEKAEIVSMGVFSGFLLNITGGLRGILEGFRWWKVRYWSFSLKEFLAGFRGGKCPEINFRGILGGFIGFQGHYKGVRWVFRGYS